jgi:hypothetical protein
MALSKGLSDATLEIKEFIGTSRISSKAPTHVGFRVLYLKADHAMNIFRYLLKG